MKQDNPFYNAVIFNSKELELKVRETKADWLDYMKKETWMNISGIATYKNKEYKVAVEFGYEGQVSNASKKRVTALDQLTQALGISTPKIHIGQNFPF
jgi:metal-dependent amidase/aminoacylase/carboxypeptidase family protein